MPWNNETYPAHKRMDLFLLHFSACRAPCGGMGLCFSWLQGTHYWSLWWFWWMNDHVNDRKQDWDSCFLGSAPMEPTIREAPDGDVLRGSYCRVVFQNVLAVDEWVLYEHNFLSWIQASGGILEVQSRNRWWRLGDSALMKWGSIFPE